MISIKNYIRPKSLEEAWELNQKRGSRIIGGMMWYRLSHKTVTTAIDLCDLHLDGIEENEKEFRLGSMVTLRSLEIHPGLRELTSGMMEKALQPIVGVQFRNLATLGGSLWGRFGFSDLLTLFLCLDATVELYRGGRVSLPDFVAMKKDRDILTGICIPKKQRKIAYEALRIQATDLPVLNLCAVSDERGLRFSVGARPGKARIYAASEFLPGDPGAFSAEEIAQRLSRIVPTESNLRGSGKYRTRLVEVLGKRALMSLRQEVTA